MLWFLWPKFGALQVLVVDWLEIKVNYTWIMLHLRDIIELKKGKSKRLINEQLWKEEMTNL